jgi:hypothetical protein
MIDVAYITLIVLAIAFLFAVFFGRPSKDEPMEETKCTDLEDFEIHWHKKDTV